MSWTRDMVTLYWSQDTLFWQVPIDHNMDVKYRYRNNVIELNFIILFLYSVPCQQVLVTLVARCLFLDSREFSQLLINSISYWQTVYTKIFCSEFMQFYCSPVWRLNLLPDNAGCVFLLATQFRESPDIFHDIFPGIFIDHRYHLLHV